jgi:hypothetical protein
MLKKYLVTNDHFGDKKYTASHRKQLKNGTPISSSIHTGNNSVQNKSINISRQSNRSYLGNTQSFQTPRTQVTHKFQTIASRKSDLR